MHINPLNSIGNFSYRFTIVLFLREYNLLCVGFTIGNLFKLQINKTYRNASF